MLSSAQCILALLSLSLFAYQTTPPYGYDLIMLLIRLGLLTIVFATKLNHANQIPTMGPCTIQGTALFGHPLATAPAGVASTSLLLSMTLVAYCSYLTAALVTTEAVDLGFLGIPIVLGDVLVTRLIQWAKTLNLVFADNDKPTGEVIEHVLTIVDYVLYLRFSGYSDKPPSETPKKGGACYCCACFRPTWIYKELNTSFKSSLFPGFCFIQSPDTGEPGRLAPQVQDSAVEGGGVHGEARNTDEDDILMTFDDLMWPLRCRKVRGESEGRTKAGLGRIDT
ncbi:hypothetical protein B0H17DRAFT_1146512 [Mycena rosella]|uniref:Uncharacterized protein n=1 Tax=Mycena rosella TaxID=1033263 RepID=A0AAD7CNS4_MYCRO|nr:hypothetical protein B0H17DRAFT_1146512 [Mycena rosella]